MTYTSNHPDISDLFLCPPYDLVDHIAHYVVSTAGEVATKILPTAWLSTFLAYKFDDGAAVTPFLHQEGFEGHLITQVRHECNGFYREKLDAIADGLCISLDEIKECGGEHPHNYTLEYGRLLPFTTEDLIESIVHTALSSNPTKSFWPDSLYPQYIQLPKESLLTTLSDSAELQELVEMYQSLVVPLDKDSVSAYAVAVTEILAKSRCLWPDDYELGSIIWRHLQQLLTPNRETVFPIADHTHKIASNEKWSAPNAPTHKCEQILFVDKPGFRAGLRIKQSLRSRSQLAYERYSIECHLEMPLTTESAFAKHRENLKRLCQIWLWTIDETSTHKLEATLTSLQFFDAWNTIPGPYGDFGYGWLTAPPLIRTVPNAIAALDDQVMLFLQNSWDCLYERPRQFTDGTIQICMTKESKTLMK